MGDQTWSHIPSRKIEMETGKQMAKKSKMLNRRFYPVNIDAMKELLN